MIALLFLAWLLVGAVGALLCVWIIGGVGALGALAPKDGKGALRLFFACDLGALGGIAGGLLMRYLDSLAQPDGTAYAGAIIGGALGAVFFPFLLFSISRLLELAFVRGRKNTLVELRLLKPLGCLILLVGPIAGIGLGGNLGYAYGTGSFLLSGVIAPLAGGITFLVVPVMIWLIGRASDEEWRTGGRMGATELSGFARMRYERVQQRRRRR